MLAAGGLAGCATAIKGDFAPKKGPRVVVIGGGWGGATAAKYVRLLDPNVEVVLIEPNRQFISCPFSNLVLAGLRTIDSLTMGYDGLRKHGVRDHPRDGHRDRARSEARPARRGVSPVRPPHRLARRGLPVGAGRRARPEPGQGAARVEGGAADRAARPAARRDARRRRVRAEHPARGLPVPAGPLRAHLDGGLVPQDQQAEVEADRARRQPEHHLEGRALPGGMAGLSEHRLPRREPRRRRGPGEQGSAHRVRQDPLRRGERDPAPARGHASRCRRTSSAATSAGARSTT